MNHRSSTALASLSLVSLLIALAIGLTGGPAAAAPTSPGATNTFSAVPAAMKSKAASGYPTSPPAKICGNATVLSGPTTQPPGSVLVDLNTNLETATEAAPAGTTFWLTAGVHTLGTDQFSQVIPKDNNVYMGAPGAILDGQGINAFAFTWHSVGVTIEYLTIQNFATPGNEAAVNHDSSANWVLQYDTIQGINSVAINVSSNGVIRYNCITRTGQTGINGLTGSAKVAIDHNEISFNATGAHALGEACGCSGGVKLFGVTDAMITNNWVHDNKSQGIWGDTNAIGYLIQGNYINNNDDEAIFFETGYNAFINNNNILSNTIVKGRVLDGRSDSFPTATLYVSESGGDSRVFGGKYSTLEISGNNLDNNYGGVILWEDANRFCNTSGNTAPGFCPTAGGASVSTCVAGTINNAPYYGDCRWHSQNVMVDNNTFRIDTSALGCVSTRCGENGIFSQTGSSPAWSPYLGNAVQNAITFGQNNHFQNNTYIGDWHFDIFSQGNKVDWPVWTGAPYNQDVGSTLTSVPKSNALDADTSTLEGSLGHWASWFATTIGRSTVQPHGGTHSLAVNVTGAGGWGVTLNNFPAFGQNPGPKVLSFWGMTTSSGSLAATMQVTFRDAAGASLQTSSVTIPALSGTWQQGTVTVMAPAGTAYMGVDLVNASGVAGSNLFFDDLVVSDAGGSVTIGPANVLDADTSTVEGSPGNWAAWFASTVARTTAQAHGGTHSLAVNVSGSGGWGVTLKNWPGFAETPGNKTISFWGMTASAASLAATMQVTFRNASGGVLQTYAVTIPALSSTWQQATLAVSAPVGTAYVGVDLVNRSGAPGNTLFFDDIVVADGGTPPPPPPPPPPNALDADTSTLEGSLGRWAAWFNSTVAQSSAQAHGGTHSLSVAVPAGGAWGVTLNNWPGFAASPGSQTISFCAMTSSAGSQAATMQVTFRNASGGVLQMNAVTIAALSAAWTKGSAVVSAPAGTAFVGVDLVSNSGVAGSTLFFDDITVG